MYQTLYYQGIKNYRIYNPGTKIGKKAKFLCNFKKSLYLCTRLTAVKDLHGSVKPRVKPRMKATVNEALTLKNPSLMYQKTFHWN